MRRMLLAWLGLLIACGTGFSASTSGDATGNWRGTLKIGDVELRLLLKVAKKADGTLTATLDSLDQGAHNLKVDKIALQDGNLHFELEILQGLYDGKVDKSGTKAVGKWIQPSQAPLPLTLEHSAADAADTTAEKLSPTELAASKRAAEKLAGHWDGTMKADKEAFRLRVNISTNSNGSASGALDSLDQGLNGIPLSAISYTDGKIHFAARGMGASYDGVSFNNATVVTGQWHQAGQTLPLSFHKQAARPVAPAK